MAPIVCLFATRVAMVGASSAKVRFNAGERFRQAGRQIAPPRRRRNSLRRPSSSAARRTSQASRAALPRSPAARQAARTASGTAKGAWDQPSLSRVPAISSAPRGRAVTRGGPRLGRRAVADHRAALDHRGSGLGLGRSDRRGDGLGIVAVDLLRVPAGGLEACARVVGEGEAGGRRRWRCRWNRRARSAG